MTQREGLILKTRRLRNGTRKFWFSDGGTAIVWGAGADKPASFYTGKTFRITERDNEANGEQWSPEKMEGWNAALASIPDALELYLDPEG